VFIYLRILRNVSISEQRISEVSIRTASYKYQSSDESRTKISNTRRTAYDSKGVARLSRLKEKTNRGLSDVSGLHNVGVRTVL
jgi:hypothetical protein